MPELIDTYAAHSKRLESLTTHSNTMEYLTSFFYDAEPQPVPEPAPEPASEPVSEPEPQPSDQDFENRAWDDGLYAIRHDALERMLELEAELAYFKWLHRTDPDQLQARCNYHPYDDGCDDGCYDCNKIVPANIIAKFGRLDVLKWMIDIKIPMNFLDLAFIAAKRDLDLLKWVMSYAPHDEEFEQETQDIYITALRAQKLENAQWLLANGAKRASLPRVILNANYSERVAVTDFLLANPELLVEKFCCWETAGTQKNIVELFAEFTSLCPAMIELLEKHSLPCGQHLVHTIPHAISLKSLNLLYEKRLLADDARARSPLEMSTDIVQWFYAHPRFAPDLLSKDALHTRSPRSTTIAWLYMEKIADPEDLLRGAVERNNTMGIKALIQCGFQIPQNVLYSMRPALQKHVLKATEEKKTADAKKVAKEVVASIVDTAMANVASES